MDSISIGPMSSLSQVDDPWIGFVTASDQGAVIANTQGADAPASFEPLKAFLDDVNVEDRGRTGQVYRGLSSHGASPRHLSHLARPNYVFAHYINRRIQARSAYVTQLKYSRFYAFNTKQDLDDDLCQAAPNESGKTAHLRDLPTELGGC